MSFPPLSFIHRMLQEVGRWGSARQDERHHIGSRLRGLEGSFTRRVLCLALVAIVAGAVTMTEAADDPMKLEGSEWGFKDDTGPRERFVQFGAGNQLSGVGGCNRFFGRYEQSGASLSISQIGATRMACLGDGVMEREQAFLGGLEAAKRIEASHLVLKLFDGNGALLMELARRDFD